VNSALIEALISRAVAAFVVTLVASCHVKPSVGDKCKASGQLVCDAKDRALVCDGKAWSSVPCKGPRGCARPEGAGATDQCDDTLGAEGDPCPAAPPLDYACTADHAEALICRDGRFALWRRCRGSRGCEVGAGEPRATGAGDGGAGHEERASEGVGDGARSVRCDTSAGAEGDPCERRGSYACTTDGKMMLVCTGAALTSASSCRGPSGCHIEAGTNRVDCDDAVADIGDPCDEPKRITCAGDHKAELVCVVGTGDAGEENPSSGHYEKKRECRRSDCSIGGSELFCD
jgi:hypothetical protein